MSGPTSDEPAARPDEPSVSADPITGPTWFRRLSSVLFVIFCFELGLFLLIYPWTDSWTENYFSIAAPDRIEPVWRVIWNNPYARGAVSGLGLVNVWIAVAEVFNMFARRHREQNSRAAGTRAH